MKSKLQQLTDGDVLLHFNKKKDLAEDLNKVLKHCFPDSIEADGTNKFYWGFSVGLVGLNNHWDCDDSNPGNKTYYPLSDFLAELEELEKQKLNEKEKSKQLPEEKQELEKKLYTLEDFKAGKVQAKRAGASDEPTLDALERKAQRQEDMILEFMKENKYTSFTPCQVHLAFGQRWPLTSVRRSLTNLAKDGHLVITGEKRSGLYGHQNNCWKYNNEKK